MQIRRPTVKSSNDRLNHPPTHTHPREMHAYKQQFQPVDQVANDRHQHTSKIDVTTTHISCHISPHTKQHTNF